MTKHRWDNTPRYRTWVKARDRALEDLHTHAQLESADVMREMLTHVLMVAKAQFYGMKHGHQSSVDWFEQGIKQQFSKASEKFVHIIEDLRARTYTLSRASESEIIAQLQQRPVTASVTPQDVHQQRYKIAKAGGALPHRINLYVDRLRRKIVSYAQASAFTAKDDLDFAKSVMVAFPRARKVTVPRRILKPQLMESEHDISSDDVPAADIAIDNVDDAAWQDMLDAYMNEYVPKTRAPEFVVGEPEVTGQKVWYAWEFERDMTNEFVQSVRDGTMDAATSNGITDFVWIAIIDNKSDQCCVWRDGLLVSEIEAQLPDHADEDDECDVNEGEGLTPPIHFNCRCTLAPATDNIPDKPDDGSKDFDDWLNS